MSGLELPRQADESAVAYSHRIGQAIPSPGKVRHLGSVTVGIDALGPSLRDPKGGQFCPRCLAESPYWRDSWEIRFVQACLVHACQLVNRCPACARAISWQRRNGFLNCRCGMPLRCCRVLPASSVAVAVTRFVVGDPDAMGALAGISLEARCRLVRAIGLAGWTRHDSAARKLTTRDLLAHVQEIAREAAGILVTRGGPVRWLFYDVATAADATGGEAHHAVTMELLRAIRSDATGQLKQQVSHWAGYPDGYDAHDRVHLCWIPLIVGSTPDMPCFIERNLGLSPKQSRDPASRVRLADVLQLRSSRMERFSVTQLRVRWDLPERLVRRLLKAYHVPAIGGIAGFAVQDIMALESRFQCPVTPESMRAYCTCQEAARQGVTHEWLIQRLCSEACRRRRIVILHEHAGTQQFLVARAVVEAFRECSRPNRGSMAWGTVSFDRVTWMTYAQANRQLKHGAGVVEYFIVRGLLWSHWHRNVGLVRRDAVRRLARRFVSAPQIARRLKISVVECKAMLEAAPLAPEHVIVHAADRVELYTRDALVHVSKLLPRATRS